MAYDLLQGGLEVSDILGCAALSSVFVSAAPAEVCLI